MPTAIYVPTPPAATAILDSKKTFCEFFAGMGLVRAGLEPSGWSCLFANDIDPRKRALYQARYSNSHHFHLGDVWQVEEVLARISGRPVLATASFPCIDVSLAGRCRGLEGKHSSAFFGFAKVLAEMRERRSPLVLLENVPGRLTSRKGQDFAAVAKTLGDMGYYLDAFVLDACQFVPQSRPRVFIVGLCAELLSAVPPAASTGSNLCDKRIEGFRRSLKLPTGWMQFPLPESPERTLMLADVIDQGEDQDWWAQAEVDRHYNMMSDAHRVQVDELLTSGRRWAGTIYRRTRGNQVRAEVRFDGLAGCLRTPKGGSSRQIVAAAVDGKLRMQWMSPREYARLLQGADDFPLAGRQTDLLRGFGDAVCAPVIAWH